MKNKIILFFTFFFFNEVSSSQDKDELLVVSVATQNTEDYQRFVQSLEYFDINYKMFQVDWNLWEGELVTSLKIMRKELKKYKNDEHLIIMYIDSYDVIFTARENEILDKFRSLNSRLIFSAQSNTNSSLKDKYSKVNDGKSFLCSDAFIGYAPAVFEAITQEDVEVTDGDDLYFENVYLNKSTREALGMTLDHKSVLFQNLHLAKDEVKFKVTSETTRIRNANYDTHPVVIHASSGASKIYLNYIGNYVPDGWNPYTSCRKCKKNLLEVNYKNDATIPHVMLAIFIEEPTPFLSEFFQNIEKLAYPTKFITLTIHNNIDAYVEKVVKFADENMGWFKSIHIIQPLDDVDETNAKNSALTYALSVEADYIFMVDSIVQITEPTLLKYLIKKNKDVIAPLVLRHKERWSNYWGALNSNGYYARSEDYLDVINYYKVGVWNVPFVSSIILMKTSAVTRLLAEVSQPFSHSTLDADMTFCSNLRNQDIFMHVSNEHAFGRLLDNDGTVTDELHPDMWELFRNEENWKLKYIHPDFYDNMKKNHKVNEPCPDTYTFPIFTPKMCDHLIETMESYINLSNDIESDSRLGGDDTENYPSIDIGFELIGYDREWLHIMKSYAANVVKNVYGGYTSDVTPHVMFLTRYQPEEILSLKPLHNKSTWTIDIALNSHGVDYEGGGSLFVRYNCSIIGQEKGWATVHPGKLTHNQERLPTTEGTRYVATSFLDP